MPLYRKDNEFWKLNSTFLKIAASQYLFLWVSDSPQQPVSLRIHLMNVGVIRRSYYAGRGPKLIALWRGFRLFFTWCYPFWMLATNKIFFFINTYVYRLLNVSAYASLYLALNNGALTSRIMCTIYENWNILNKLSNSSRPYIWYSSTWKINYFLNIWSFEQKWNIAHSSSNNIYCVTWSTGSFYHSMHFNNFCLFVNLLLFLYSCWIYLIKYHKSA